tara:strand:- start:897 stop:1598 length:702 start_codon:yes stop_codon:yes gene_type:complete
MKILAVRIGDKYGPEYETYLEKKLPEYEFIWVREPIKPNIALQWNKMWGMQLDIDEPICVMDIDMLLINDYKKVFEYPIKKGQFVAIPGWWREQTPNHKINGGFFKYYPKDCKYIYDKFMKDIDYWQEYYIKNGTTTGPVNGEQHFVEDTARERLEVITMPNSWVTRWCTEEKLEEDDKDLVQWQLNMTKKYNKATGNMYIYMGGKFHEDLKLIHFTQSQNKPHLWKDYDVHL